MEDRVAALRRTHAQLDREIAAIDAQLIERQAARRKAAADLASAEDELAGARSLAQTRALRDHYTARLNQLRGQVEQIKAGRVPTTTSRPDDDDDNAVPSPLPRASSMHYVSVPLRDPRVAAASSKKPSPVTPAEIARVIDVLVLEMRTDDAGVRTSRFADLVALYSELRNDLEKSAGHTLYNASRIPRPTLNVPARPYVPHDKLLDLGEAGGEHPKRGRGHAHGWEGDE